MPSIVRRAADGAVAVVCAGNSWDIATPRLDNVVVQTVNQVVEFVDGVDG
jgi:hypothetical protein